MHQLSGGSIVNTTLILKSHQLVKLQYKRVESVPGNHSFASKEGKK